MLHQGCTSPFDSFFWKHPSNKNLQVLKPLPNKTIKKTKSRGYLGSPVF